MKRRVHLVARHLVLLVDSISLGAYAYVILGADLSCSPNQYSNIFYMVSSTKL